MASSRTNGGRGAAGLPSLLLGAALALPAQAATYRVAEIAAPVVTGGSNPAGFTLLGGVVLFSACDPFHGCELWRSDGTAAGTTIVKDLQPGPGGSSPQGLARFGAFVYFAADDGASGS